MTKLGKDIIAGLTEAITWSRGEAPDIEVYKAVVDDVTCLTAERDAALAEVQRLREATSKLCHWATQAVDLLGTVKPLEEPAVTGWVMRETTEAVSSARALVSPP